MTDTTDNLHVMNRAALTKRLVGKLTNREAVGLLMTSHHHPLEEVA